MCKIGINLNSMTPEGTNIVSALGRYRVSGGGTNDWELFTISLTNPQTPDIKVVGSYELEVNVTNNLTDTSEWSNRVTFSVSSNCNGDIVVNDECYSWYVDVNIGEIETPKISYIDCDNNPIMLDAQYSQNICAKEISWVDLGNGTINNVTNTTSGPWGSLNKGGTCSTSDTRVHTGDRCNQWIVSANNSVPQGERIRVTYVDCYDDTQTIYVTANSSTSFCAYTINDFELGQMMNTDITDLEGTWGTLRITDVTDCK